MGLNKFKTAHKKDVFKKMNMQATAGKKYF